MATFKFFNIGTANKRIEELEAENVLLKEQAKVAEENGEQVAKAAEENAAKLTQAEADLSTAKQTISTLTARAEKAEAELKAANEKLANPSAQVIQIASRKAQEITAAQGQPPISATVPQTTGTGDILAQYAALKDPAAKNAFYRKHKAEYDAAFRSKNPFDTNNR